MQLIAIAAVTNKGVIGKDNKLPWARQREDLKRFRKMTLGYPIIMGRKTRESLPHNEPLEARYNITVSSTFQPASYEAAATSVAKAIILAGTVPTLRPRKAFIIGGARLYKATLPICDEAFITRIIAPKLEGDTFFQTDWLEGMSLLCTEHFSKDDQNEYDMTFEHWVR